VTPQRRVVAEVLDGEHVHLTAESVHCYAQERLPEISLATVYNTLNELVAMGEVLEVQTGDGPKRYDPNVTVPHHHLVCTNCGTLRDVLMATNPDVELPNGERFGFEITGVDIVFQGICPTCAKHNSSSSQPPRSSRSIPS
jgi:Fur family ferric uptake transcriptional regulator